MQLMKTLSVGSIYFSSRFHNFVDKHQYEDKKNLKNYAQRLFTLLKMNILRCTNQEKHFQLNILFWRCVDFIVPFHTILYFL